MKIVSRQEAIAQKLTRYFTGKPCKHGHIAERLICGSQCLECNRLRAKAKNAAWRARNPDKVKKHKHDTYMRHRERLLKEQNQYRTEHKERYQAYFKSYKKTNNGKVNATNKRRDLAKKQRTPAWLTADDFWIMQEIYELAALRSRMTGFKWHVDHIVPLQGTTVSGLHVPINLQVIPYRDNILKRNHHG